MIGDGGRSMTAMIESAGSNVGVRHGPGILDLLDRPPQQ